MKKVRKALPFCDRGGLPGGKSGSQCCWLLRALPGEASDEWLGVAPEYLRVPKEMIKFDRIRKEATRKAATH